MQIQANIDTNKGTIKIDFLPEHAPMTVANFINLAQRGFYDDLTRHRVISDFMIQGGCPNGTGTGGPGYRFGDEFHDHQYHDRAGILSMANAGPGTNGSQFFITHGPTPHLDNVHTVFGMVQGDDDQTVVDAIEQGDSITKIIITGDYDQLFEQVAEFLSQINQALDADPASSTS